MGEPTKLTCFIAAPRNVDTSVIRSALEDRNVEWVDATSAQPGSSILDTIESAIKSGDFICVVITKDVLATNVYFEFGLARGLKKPVLLFVEPGIGLPTEWTSFAYVRSNLKDRETINFNLDIFLEHLRSRPKRHIRQYALPQKRIDVGWARKRLANIEKMSDDMAYDKALEELIAKLFEQMGAIVKRQPGPSERGADMAVWIDDIQSSIGNPLLVELKTGHVTESQMAKAEGQLRKYILDTSAKAALLVYLDIKLKRFATIKFRWPLIFRLSVRDLIELVGSGNLVKTLLDERNKAAHSKD